MGLGEKGHVGLFYHLCRLSASRALTGGGWKVEGGGWRIRGSRQRIRGPGSMRTDEKVVWNDVVYAKCQHLPFEHIWLKSLWFRVFRSQSEQVQVEHIWLTSDRGLKIEAERQRLYTSQDASRVVSPKLLQPVSPTCPRAIPIPP